MIHNIQSVTFYQTVTIREEAINGRKAFNTIDNTLLPGVAISRKGDSIVLLHSDWDSSYCVGMANVRHYRFEKVESKEDEKAKALERNKNLGTSASSDADSQSNDSNDLVNSLQYENTDTITVKSDGHPDVILPDGYTIDNSGIITKREGIKAINQKKIKSKKVKKKTKKKVSKKCTAKKKKSS